MESVPLPTAPSPRWRRVLTGGMLAAVVLLSYWPCLRGGLLWDDDSHVTRAELRSLHGLGRIWSEIGATQQYYPVLHSAFWVEYHLWAGAPLGYHLINLLWHATAACLLVAILRRLAVPGAVFAGLIFALHPIGVESVAWISEQKNTLSGMFYFAAALAYLRFDEKGGKSPAPYLLATLLYLLALFSKTVTATLPAALLVVLWWKRGRLSWRQDVVPLLPWFAVGIAAGIGTAAVERSLIGAQGGPFELSFLQRLLLAGRVIWFYLGKAIWPAHLVFIYPRWAVDSSDWRAYLAPAAFLIVLAALWLRAGGGRRGPLAGCLYFAGTLFPALGFFNIYPFRFSFVADHFQYLACLGVIVPVAAGLALALERSAPPWRRIGQGLALAAALVLGLLTFRQSRIYRSAETLYRSTIARNPLSWMAYNNLGVILTRDPGRLDEAIACFRTALRIYPDYAEAHNNLGSALLARADLGNAMIEAGRIGEGMAEFDAALRLDPTSAQARDNRGRAWLKLGRPQRAAEDFRLVLRLNPDDAEAHLNLGNALSQSGDNDAAMREYQTAVRLRPEYAEAHVNLGIALRRIGRIEDAAGHFETALRIDPNQTDAHFSLGNVLLRQNRIPQAIAQFEAVVRIKPDDIAAQNNLAAALCQEGRIQEAIDHLETVLRLRPDSDTTRLNLEKVRAMLR